MVRFFATQTVKSLLCKARSLTYWIENWKRSLRVKNN